MEPFTAIVLAGGASARMGRPKALLPFGTETLIERIVRRLAPCSSEVVVVRGPHVRLPRLPDEVRVVEDEVPLQGPVAGIRYGLAAAHTEFGFVCGCDHPFLEPAIARLLAERTGDGDGAIVVWKGVPQPLLAVYRKRVATIAATMLASGERRAVRLVEHARLVEVSDEELFAVDPSGLSLLDVDTPQSYHDALARLDPFAR
jgi:molybdopterin-guanine dinucleotide biosynthesis protein A